MRLRVNWHDALDAVATVALVAASGTMIWAQLRSLRPTQQVQPTTLAGNRRPEPPLPDAPVSIDGATIKGKEGAKVALIVYSDFQCPFCAKFATQVLPSFDERFVKSGKALVAFRQMPLPMHQFAPKAAQASYCAGEQGQFWPMHDALFADPKHLDEPALLDRAQRLGLRDAEFKLCLRGKAPATIDQDRSSADELSVSGTPTIFVGVVQPDSRVKLVRRFAGVPATQELDAAVTSLLDNNGKK